VHKRLAGVLTAAAVLVAVAFVTAGQASAGRAPQAAFTPADHRVHVTAKGKLCNNIDDRMSDAVSSQNFDKKWNDYDAVGATDCKLKKTATVHSVIVPGTYFNGSGPADSENVTTYKDSGGLPGKKVDSQTVVGSDDAGTFTISLKALKLAKGTYWFAVQANMDFSNGQWGWLATATAHGSPDQWENPGGGFGLGCKSWCPVGTLDGGMSRDLMIGLS
jgi:hypothetical protein